MTPSPRLALLVATAAVAGVLLPLPVAVIAVLGLLAAGAADAWSVRRLPDVSIEVPRVLARGVVSHLRVRVDAVRARVRQAAPPDLRVDPNAAGGALDAALLPRRRGRHVLPPPAVRVTGAAGLGAWMHAAAGEPVEVTVYPDLPAAYRIVSSIRRGSFAETGRLRRGPLGLGTDFESVRDYLPDDDIRQVNWRATARLGRPMSNQYRVEQDRDVVCLIDSGRLMAAPLGPRPDDPTRIDAALDAVAAIAMTADELGDRCGVVAFDATVRRQVRPRRGGGRRVVQAVLDLEAAPVDSDYELAFRTVGGGKRSLVVVLTDLLEDAAARPLLDAIGVLTRRHAVVVASASDGDLDALVRTPPSDVRDVYAASVAVDVLRARSRVVARLRASGADVVEAAAGRLGEACVAAYLRAKVRARL